MKMRGPTLVASIDGMDNEKQIVVDINELGQPIGEGGHKLKIFLGTIARLSEKLPIDVPTWRAMPTVQKDDVWEYVLFKTNGSTLDRGDLFLKTCVKKNGLPVNEDTATVIENFQNVKLTQLSSSKSSFASVNDTYEQVFGKDRPGRVRGVGTGPTPKSMWGSKEEVLREQNLMLHNTLTDMQDRLKKLECIANESKQVDYVAGPEKCVQPSTSTFEPKQKMISMLKRKVKLCDMYRRPITGGIAMAEEMSKIVMGKKLGEVYLEIFVLIPYDPDAPLFVRDRDRETIKDAAGSHIIWLRDFKLSPFKSMTASGVSSGIRGYRAEFLTEEQQERFTSVKIK
ncbi:hypothetical protein Taro_001166, partial [Colocasia esculenta]|nr:hypothetical protein [Colocasia esculenta]